MAAIGRLGIGTVALLACGLGLGALMVYTLVGPDGLASAARHQVDSEVAVFFQDQNEWADFREGVATCVRKGLLRHLADGDGMVLVETPNAGRRLRFTWHRTRGIGETRAQVKALAEGPRPPSAVVGSGNTLCTMVLAEGLRDARSDATAPVLLVPWATAVRSRPTSGDREPVRLLEVYRGRTFRFCPDNRHEAELLVRCLIDREPKARPARAVVVIDRTDPFSVDLADGFKAAIEEAAPGTEIEECDDVISDMGGMGIANESGVSLWADHVWADAAKGPTWVVLPLQSEPSRQLIATLRAQGKGHEADLTVLCGDGVGLDFLEEISGQGPFPVWAVSSAALPRPGGVGPDVQVPAEIVAALARVLDDGDEIDPAARLSALEIAAEDAAAVAGRSLAFEKTGERRGDDLGHVLATKPGRRGVFAYERTKEGGCREATLHIPPAVEVRR